MSPAEIRGLLDERFRLLTGGRRSAVERHQTLRATVDWSYSLLGEQERAVFDRLGVFAGGFDARAAQAVVEGDGVEAWDVLDALTELVVKSMIVAEETADGTTRYQMLETLGQYARERLDEHGNSDGWRRRHAEYFAVWAEEAGPGLVGPDEFVWRERESVELDNLRAAVTWALDRDDPDDLGLALRIVGSLAAESQANPTAGVGSWAERALPKVESTSAPMRYAVTAAAAWYQFDVGHYERALQLARRAIDEGVPAGAPAADKAHLALGVSTLMLGDGAGALAIQQESARLLDRDFPGTASAAHAHAVAALAAQLAGDPVARAEAKQGLNHARTSANPTALVIAHMAMGRALERDDPMAALAAYEDGLALLRRGASPTMHGATLNFAAAVRARTGELVRAVADLREGLERSHLHGTPTLFYMGVWVGIEVLVALDRGVEVAVFDGIASNVDRGLAPGYRTAPGWSYQIEAVARARANLGSGPYDEAYTMGMAMSQDEAVEHSLRVLDDLVDATRAQPSAVTGSPA
jgi:tetratricopeptide (TPR) repeat protein